MDQETGCGLSSTGQNVRLLIGAAYGFQYSIGRILATAVRPLTWLLQTSDYQALWVVLFHENTTNKCINH